MFFRPIVDEGLAQNSYIIGCPSSGEALVVDPRRDIDVYLEVAKANGLRITGVTETHIHADFLSGARELARATGAALYLSAEGGSDWLYGGLEGFDHRPLQDGETIAVGNVKVEALHTPGHTPEHLSFLVSEKNNATAPMLFLSGDFIFVGDVGRPDLLEEAVGIAGSAQSGARTLFRSLQRVLQRLPDYVQIWPAHGAGSACGKAIGAVPSTTLGYERLVSWWSSFVQKGDEAGFVATILDGQPDAPTYFGIMKRLNRDGMRILGELPRPKRLDATGLDEALRRGAVLVDTRDAHSFARGHRPGAISISLGKNFSSWAGWLLPYDRPLLLLAPAGAVEDAVRWLVRVGLDDVIGYVEPADALDAHVEPLPQVEAPEAERRRRAGEAAIVDVRTTSEYRLGHVPGALHIPASRILREASRVPKDKPVIVHCGTGARSSATVSALMAAGFTNLTNLVGGFDEWQRRGLPVERGIEAGQPAAVR